jgi:hypothetical protein
MIFPIRRRDASWSRLDQLRMAANCLASRMLLANAQVQTSCADAGDDDRSSGITDYGLGFFGGTSYTTETEPSSPWMTSSSGIQSSGT